ncbi:LysR family transcriptional regulator [Vibrio hippocampi]|nr:LysR family transcriptional regulator [Vibrio hippocampi]
MDNKTLKTFVSVARHKNFSAAANELHSVQPTVSRHISDLEQQLGVKLFVRTTHVVELTKAGEWLLPEAVNILANEKRVKKQITQLDKNIEQKINIGYLATACSFFLPCLLDQYSEQHSNVVANLHEMAGQQQEDALIEGEIDVAFSRRQPTLDGNLFHVDKIYSDHLVAVLPFSHPLSCRSSIDLIELANDKFILFQRSLWIEIFDHILSQCQEVGFAPNIIRYPENMHNLVMSVSSGQGISIAPSCIRFVAESTCACIPIPKLEHALPLYLYYRRAEDKEHLKEFASLCIKLASHIQERLSIE